MLPVLFNYTMRIKSKILKLKFLFIAIFMLAYSTSYAQDPISDEETFEARYQRNIKKSRINGTYIPEDIEDAMVELSALSSKEALAKFRNAPEDIVSTKLHFGLGRWMIYNWNFYEGSRYSHYLKMSGVNHPDDMAKFTIICLHRKLNNIPLDINGLALSLEADRRKKMEEGKQDATIIKQETKIKLKKN